MSQAKTQRSVTYYVRMFICMLVTVVLASSMLPIVPQAYAANAEKPEKVIMQLYGQNSQIDVTKEVATLNNKMGKGVLIPFEVRDKYTNVANANKIRRLVLEDSKGKQTQVSESRGNTVALEAEKIVVGSKLKLITLTKGDGDKDFVKRYEQQLNVRFADAKKAEQKPAATTGSGDGLSQDGSTWSFSNGLEVKLANTGFKFLDGTTINLGVFKLPLQYKHKPDGTTIVGINCSPEDQAFYNAVKNGNAFQKYSSEKMQQMVAKMEKGWSGKGIGKWGGKGLDWNVMGYMEYNTKDPTAPRAVNLIISMGMKAEGHAQYLCFTGSLTFTVGGKATLVGKLTPGKGVEGQFKLGGYGGLELYIGLGLNYVASVGTYGKGRIDIDFLVLPKFMLDTIKISGAFGVKAKVFGFTIFTWDILKGEKLLYPKDGKKKMPAQDAQNEQSTQNADGTAATLFDVDADTAYPVDSRAYLDESDGLAVAQSDALAPQASTDSKTILQGIYGETEMSCATTNDGPVVVYIADGAQVGDKTRDTYNRSVLAYTRLKNGQWTTPKVIDTTAKSGKFADYSPTIHTDGDNCYVTWLSADSKIDKGASIAQVGKKLDVNIATITKDDKITVETVYEESSNDGTMPASPQAVKVGNDLYVGWFTNQTSGSNSQVIGLSGSHNIRLYKRGSDGKWTKSSEVTSGQNGAITSFDVGSYGGTATCAWSLDAKFNAQAAEESLNGVQTLNDSCTVYALTPGSTEAKIVAIRATTAQFAKQEGKDVLTYAIKKGETGDPNNISSADVSVYSSPSLGGTATEVLDGSKVYLPTSNYVITGDLGKGRAGNISFLKSGDGNCDIQALVTKGAGNTDWSSVVEATADTATITDYCATYANGQPLFIYTTERATTSSGGITPQDDESSDDGSVDMNQSTEESLKHLSVTDVDFDEYAVKAGEQLPMTVYFDNDGLLDVAGADLWVLENGTATKVASNDDAVEMDGEGTISFEYTVPPKDQFTKARELTLYAAPKGATVTDDKIKRELEDESAMTVSLGDASLSLEVVHRLVDDQESIEATVTNDGIVPHNARMLFINSDTGDTLYTVDVPNLTEAETATSTYSAPKGYFENDGIKNITITLVDDGSDASKADYYEINNTEFVSTWEQNPETVDDSTNTDTKGSSANPKASAKSPSTGDQLMLTLILALIALAIISLPAITQAVRKLRE